MIRQNSLVRYWRGQIMAGMMSAVMLLPAAHPVHVSSTQIELSRDESRLKVTVRIFTDDLETALAGIGHRVALQTSSAATIDTALSRYLGDRLLFTIDGVAVRGRVTGHQREDNATLTFVDVPIRAVPARITIMQRVMLEMFEDQTNLLHLRVRDKKRSALLRQRNDRAEFVL